MRKQDRIENQRKSQSPPESQDPERTRGSGESERMRGSGDSDRMRGSSESERMKGGGSDSQRPQRQSGKLPLPD